MERNKQYLLYFGSVFLWSEVEAVPGIGHFMEPPKVLKDEISMDIAVLRSARFLDKKKGSISWTITGRFVQVPDTNMWLYQHSNHVNCSVAMYENFLSMCKVNKQDMTCMHVQTCIRICINKLALRHHVQTCTCLYNACSNLH